MIPSLPRPLTQRIGLNTFVVLFFVFLFVPLLVVALFAFNNAPYPTPPWMGFTLDWFVAQGGTRTGLLHDAQLIASLGTSAWVALWVTLLSVGVGTCNAFLLERFEFPGKGLIALLSMLPLVIPGVILGISILALASRVANFADETWGLELDFLRPGLPLVILGQFCYIVTIATLTISASLRRFDRTLEEAAYNLGASRAAVLWTITLPYLRPSMIGAAAMAFL
ncbi:MAG: ABC transporter permease subunit, partial [Pseudomonadota bacterium]